MYFKMDLNSKTLVWFHCTYEYINIVSFKVQLVPLFPCSLVPSSPRPLVHSGRLCQAVNRILVSLLWEPTRWTFQWHCRQAIVQHLGDLLYCETSVHINMFMFVCLFVFVCLCVCVCVCRRDHFLVGHRLVTVGWHYKPGCMKLIERYLSEEDPLP